MEKEKRHSILESVDLNNPMYHNDDSSIMNTQTIEHRDEEMNTNEGTKEKALLTGGAQLEEAA